MISFITNINIHFIRLRNFLRKEIGTKDAQNKVDKIMNIVLQGFAKQFGYKVCLKNDLVFQTLYPNHYKELNVSCEGIQLQTLVQNKNSFIKVCLDIFMHLMMQLRSRHRDCWVNKRICVGGIQCLF